MVEIEDDPKRAQDDDEENESHEIKYEHHPAGFGLFAKMHEEHELDKGLRDG